MMYFLRRNRGITLAEVVVVITVIGVLTSVVIVAILQVKQKSRDERRLADLQTLQLALRLYKEAYGKYPLSGCGAGLMNNTSYPAGSTSPAGTNSPNLWQWASPGPFTSGLGAGGRDITVTCENYIEGLVPEYIIELPKDPVSENSPDLGFSYMTNFGQTEYKLLVAGSVEAEHPQSDHEFARCPAICPRLGTQQNVAAPSWCFETPNYSVYSNTSFSPCW